MDPLHANVSSARKVASLLLERGFLDARAVVRDSIRIEEQSRRAGSFLVYVDGRPNWFVKTGHRDWDPSLLRREAVVTRGLAEVAGLRKVVLAPLLTDPVLVQPALPTAISMERLCTETRRVPLSLATALGRAVARTHQASPGVLGEFHARPLAFELDRPPLALFEDCSPAASYVIETAQNSAPLSELLERLRGEWSPRCFLHGDLRLDNMLAVSANGSGGGRRSIRLVDWEFAGYGDPRHDVATVLAQLIALWLESLPAVGERMLAAALPRARFPLQSVRNAADRFLTAYRGTVGCSTSCTSSGLPHPEFVAAALAQAAFERTQFSLYLDPTSALLLQLAVNLAQDPDGGVSLLLGIA